MPVKMLNMPAMMNREVKTALHMARLPVVAAIAQDLLMVPTHSSHSHPHKHGNGQRT